MAMSKENLYRMIWVGTDL